MPAGPVVNFYSGGAPGSFWRTWLPVFVAMLSAAIAGFSAWLAWRNQVLGFAKDIAAVERDQRSRQGTLALQAFENSVARPAGQSLDLIDRVMLELGKVSPAGAASVDDALQQYGRSAYADIARCTRLCQEADRALPTGRPVVFELAFIDAALEGKLIAAAAETLKGDAGDAYDDAADAVVDLKVAIRQALERERAAEAARWQEALGEDPFIKQAERLLPRWLRRVKADRG